MMDIRVFKDDQRFEELGWLRLSRMGYVYVEEALAEGREITLDDDVFHRFKVRRYAPTDPLNPDTFPVSVYSPTRNVDTGEISLILVRGSPKLRPRPSVSSAAISGTN